MVILQDNKKKRWPRLDVVLFERMRLASLCYARSLWLLYWQNGTNPVFRPFRAVLAYTVFIKRAIGVVAANKLVVVH